MVKEYKIGSFIVNDNSAITTNYNQFHWDGTYYWYFKMANQTLQRSIDCLTWNDIATFSIPAGYTFESTPIHTGLKVFGADVYLSFVCTKTGVDSRLYICKWNGSTLSTAYNAVTATGCRGSTLFKIGTSVYGVFELFGASLHNVYFVDVSGSTIATVTSDGYISNGYCDDLKYYFLNKNGSTIELYSFNGSAATLVADYSSYFSDFSVIYSYYMTNTQYFRKNNVEIFATFNSIKWRSSSTSNWNIYTLTTPWANFVPVWGLNNLMHWILFVSNGLWYGLNISSNGGIIVLQKIGTSLGENYAMASNNIILVSGDTGLTRGIIPFSLQTIVNSEIYLVPKTNIIDYTSSAYLYNYDLDDEEGVILYDDLDNLIFKGYPDVDYIKGTNAVEEGIHLISPLNADLAETYSGTFAVGTAPETVIATILGTCKFASAGTLDASGLTLAAAITYKNKAKSAIITDMLKLMARCVEINPSLQISVKSTPTDSTKTLTFETNSETTAFSIQSSNRKRIKASNVKLRYGKALTLYEQRGSAANEYEIQDIYPQIESAADIARIATQILNSAAPFYDLYIVVIGHGKFIAGQTLTLSYSPDSIPEETYYIYEESYNSITGNALLRVVNLLKFKIQSGQEQLQTQLDTVTTTANAAAVATTSSTANNLVKFSGTDGKTLADSGYSSSSFVKMLGDETVAGVKTFSSFPVTPSSAPTTSYQVANKLYVDTKVKSLRCEVYRSGDQSSFNAGSQAVTWNGLNSNTTDFRNGSDQTKIVVPEAGTYLVTCTISIYNTNTGGGRVPYLLINGGTQEYGHCDFYAWQTNMRVKIATQLVLSANDYFRIYCWSSQNSNTIKGSSSTTYFTTICVITKVAN